MWEQKQWRNNFAHEGALKKDLVKVNVTMTKKKVDGEVREQV